LIKLVVIIDSEVSRTNTRIRGGRVPEMGLRTVKAEVERNALTMRRNWHKEVVVIIEKGPEQDNVGDGTEVD
jgi:hypothetical protein